MTKRFGVVVFLVLFGGLLAPQRAEAEAYRLSVSINQDDVQPSEDASEVTMVDAKSSFHLFLNVFKTEGASIPSENLRVKVAIKHRDSGGAGDEAPVFSPMEIMGSAGDHCNPLALVWSKPEPPYSHFTFECTKDLNRGSAKFRIGIQTPGNYIIVASLWVENRKMSEGKVEVTVIPASE